MSRTSRTTAPALPTPDPSWLGLLLTVLLPLIFIGAIIFFMMRQAQGTNNQAMSFGKSRARMFTGNKPTVTFADVAGVEEAKEELARRSSSSSSTRRSSRARRAHPARRAAGRPARHRQDAARPRRRRRGRRAVLQHLRLRVRRDVRRRRRQPRARPVRPGQAQRALHRLRRRDRRGRPPARRRPGRQPRRARADPQPDPGRDGRLRHQHERDRHRRHQPAGRARPGAAAARPLRPPGRSSTAPTSRAGAAILEVHAKGKPLDEDVSSSKAGRAPDARLLRRRPGEPGQRGARSWPRAATRRPIGMRRDRRRRSTASSPGPSARAASSPTREARSSPTTRPVTRSCADACPSATRSHKVTIVARGMAGGYTRALPDEDRYLQTKTAVRGQAGRAAGRPRRRGAWSSARSTTGAANDIEKATDLARRMVTEFGMSEQLGPLAFGKREELVFLGREIGEQRNYSDEVARTRSTRRSARSSTRRTTGRTRSSRPTATSSIAWPRSSSRRRPSTPSSRRCSATCPRRPDAPRHPAGHRPRHRRWHRPARRPPPPTPRRARVPALGRGHRDSTHDGGPPRSAVFVSGRRVRGPTSTDPLDDSMTGLSDPPATAIDPPSRPPAACPPSPVPRRCSSSCASRRQRSVRARGRRPLRRRVARGAPPRRPRPRRGLRDAGPPDRLRGLAPRSRRADRHRLRPLRRAAGRPARPVEPATVRADRGGRPDLRAWRGRRQGPGPSSPLGRTRLAGSAGPIAAQPPSRVRGRGGGRLRQLRGVARGQPLTPGVGPRRHLGFGVLRRQPSGDHDQPARQHLSPGGRRRTVARPPFGPVRGPRAEPGQRPGPDPRLPPARGRPCRGTGLLRRGRRADRGAAGGPGAPAVLRERDGRSGGRAGLVR